ncbi:hypothetical protein ACFWJM_02190 [Streptomyces sp. NPDC127077]|uniref:hypothetical protein n=1 Tax=Streptomyces sp. NPDC127077 TaxID=3347131 RepID=UPI00365CD98D
MRDMHRADMLGRGRSTDRRLRTDRMRMARGAEPYIGAQVMIGVLLLAVDLAYIAGLWFAYGFAGWTDDGGIAPEAQMFAWRTTWYLAGGAVVTGGGLLVLRWRIPGAVQLIVLGIGALEFHSLAAHR